MNSKVILVLLVLASTLLFEAEAFTAGAGGLEGRKRGFSGCVETANRLQHLCAVAEVACQGPVKKRAVEAEK